MVEEKRPSLFQRLTRRTTPKPEDRTIYNPGIQEKDTSYLVTAPIVYQIVVMNTSKQ